MTLWEDFHFIKSSAFMINPFLPTTINLPLLDVELLKELKLLNTLPSILKYLPVEKAQDARTFILSFQYCVTFI